MLEKIDTKRADGRYYTEGSPFHLTAFQNWAADNNLSQKKILEPFAGSNNLIEMLKAMDMCSEYASYDIKPTAKEVQTRDTINSFPKDFDICVTNPPWLARNSATRRGISFPNCQFDDLYKHCLSLCLANCKAVAAIVPASFLQSGLFRDRLQKYILIHDTIFSDTENPVCLALFGEISKEIKIYYDENYLGNLNELEQCLPKNKNACAVKFNDPNGNLGFISFDNTKEPSIKFCNADEIADYEIKQSSRFITRISGKFGDVDELANNLNKKIKQFRKETKDVFLTPFKGIRDDGLYRRRMDFALARRFINDAQPKNELSLF